MRKQRGFTRAEFLAVIAVAVVVFGAILATTGTLAAKKSRAQATLVACKENLRKIGVGLLAYVQDHQGHLPVSATLENPQTQFVECMALVPQPYIADPKILYCPAQPALTYSERNLSAGIIGYFYYSAAASGDDARLSRFLRTGVSWPRELNTQLDPQSWVMSDIWFSGDPTAHDSYKKGVNYLTLDGAVGFVSESPRQAFR